MYFKQITRRHEDRFLSLTITHLSSISLIRSGSVFLRLSAMNSSTFQNGCSRLINVECPWVLNPRFSGIAGLLTAPLYTDNVLVINNQPVFSLSLKAP